MVHTGDTVEAVLTGCSVCEHLRCDGTVGYGGSPDETGETTLDAMVMHGPTGDIGAVAGLKRIKNAVRVAAAVMKYTTHSLIVGEAATRFALEMGFEESDLHTKDSIDMWKAWAEAQCQPNFRRNVIPDPTQHCGPYKPLPEGDKGSGPYDASALSHDTIGMIALHRGNLSVATSTNGARHKVPGRVGDSPIPGAGGYADNEIGAACATGDGDTLMKMLPSYQAVENMRQGMHPNEATADVIGRIAKKYAHFKGAVIAVNKYGTVGGACHGFDRFSYSVRRGEPNEVQVVPVTCS
ncbi:N(4) (Beta N acetylglucosaminyl) L asparaginase [Trichuris trichiura]|uniref:N(4)-(beta-N-acetylglucosaminyl)-L-asparaginase n=1 Tax=Trichuris trichiura TaxID=36087 RepID=A0A077Z1K4_TRITR|nr:N(4) (Beta N acetylglucosaminyl) L asparaginase [Trichuris trichiura]